MNLIEEIAAHLGYPPLEKIKPINDEPAADAIINNEQLFAQAAIPAVLVALYKYSLSDEGAANIIGTERTWANNLFFNEASQVVGTIASYSGKTEGEVQQALPKVIEASITKINEANSSDNTMHTVRNYLANERNQFLPYLPPQLHMGDVLQDNTIDDKTNKMEGPVSNLIKSIGNVFDSPDDVEK